MAATFDPEVDATFISGPHGRDSHLALWGPGLGPAPDEVELIVPAGTQVRQRSIPARLMPIAASIDPLAELAAGAEVQPSVRAWSVAAKVALDLLARGRLLPTVSEDGTDVWILGPLDPDDHAVIEKLADALPPAAHAVPVPGTSPRRIQAARASVVAFLNAVADAFVRTPAAPVASGHGAFAGLDAHDVSRQRDWLRSTASGATGDAIANLRVEMPDDPDRPVAVVVELHSRIDPGLVIPAAELWAAPAAVAARFGREADTELLVTLRRASRVWAPIGRLLADARPDRLELDDTEAEELFGPLSDDLAAAGLPVLWPASVFGSVEMRSVITTPAPDKVSGAGLDLASLGELRWRAALDGEDLTDEELALLAEAKRPIVRMRGRWVRADPERLRRIQQRRPVEAGELLSAALSGTVVVDGEEIQAELEASPLADLIERLRTIDEPEGVWEHPEGLNAVLRPYQQRGVQWMAEMASLRLGGVLADDMGLGKTVQVLALHLQRRQHGPLLVVCPASLLGNWEREAERFAPDLPVRRFHGADRSLAELAPDELVITTYGVVRQDPDAFAAAGWDLVIADEAQAVKNPYSRTARALRRIASTARIALTGTPVENRLADLWALLDWTTPGLLGPLDRFQRTVAVPVERDRDEYASARLAAVVRPFLLRRRKTDPLIAPDLPPKTETDRFVGLTTEQASLYQAVTEELLNKLEYVDGISRKGLVLKMLTGLKQICNHPAQYLGQAGPIAGRSGKLEAVTDLLGVIVDEDDSALVFTQFVAMGHLLEEHLRAKGIATVFLHGGTPVGRRQEMVDAFQSGSPQVFIVSLRAGGTGLNLTRATHVIHYDRWWNPAVEDQASDRAWRMGQDRPVQVHRMICEGTMEEKISAVLESKRELADAVVGGGEAWLSELSDAELTDLVSLGSY